MEGLRRGRRHRRKTHSRLLWIVLHLLLRRRVPVSGLARPARPLARRPLAERLAVERGLRRQRGLQYLIGSDESGTGAIAGPVVCASVCLRCDLDAYEPLPEVDDAKALGAAVRRRLWRHILAHPETYAVATAVREAVEIDGSDARTMALDGFRETIGAVARQMDPNGTTMVLLSIVDGHKSPRGLPGLSSRAVKQADAHVYTVALASIVAQATREALMQEVYAPLYPRHHFERNQGYSSPEHVQAIHAHGPTPIHRLTTRPLRGRGAAEGVATANAATTTRRTLLQSGFAAAATAAGGALVAPRPARSASALLPGPGEIAAAVPTDWTGIENPFEGPDAAGRYFNRLDSNPDAAFYADPRFGEHVDEQAVRLLTRYVSDAVAGTDAVLDLGSSWTSHVQFGDEAVPPRRFVGLGMNRAELAANPVLTERLVQDLNQDARLPFPDDAFDVALCQLSIDYLTRPLEVCRELGRVLRPGGTVHVLFSNRLFLQKAVAVWTGADDVDHAYTVACYLHFGGAGRLGQVRAADLSVRRRGGAVVGDPLYVVTATKVA